jgi:hypothetical protein
LDIDSQSINESTKQYAKCLVVSDFVYAVFSFQFLGPVYGLARDSAFVATWAQWDTLPLNVCYDIGNTNQVSLFCAQRTSFYLRLVNNLLKVKGYSVTIPNGVHVFPVLKLQSGEYIVDPYDPFVICDSDKKWIVDYQRLLRSKSDDNFKPVRTRRLYGNTRQLFSLTYVNMLKDSYKDRYKDCFCCTIKEYLKENRSFLMSKLKSCFDIPDQPLFQNTHIIPNSHNIYSIDMIGRVDGPLTTYKDIIRYYIGLHCDSVSAEKNSKE